MSEIEEQINRVLEQIRPSLRMDAGDIELVEFDAGIVKVRFHGACVGCPMSEITLKMGIESVMREAIPQVKEVIAVE